MLPTEPFEVMPGRRTLLVALGVGVAILLIAAPSSAQNEGSGEAPDISPGFLYFDTQEVAKVPHCYEPTATQSVFNLTPAVPREEEAGKAYTTGEGGYISCFTALSSQARTGFTLGSGTHVTFWLGCDRDTPMYSTARIDQLSDYAVFLNHNGEQVTEYRGDYDFPFREIGGCSSGIYNAPPLLRLEAPLDPPETTVAPGDNITLQIALFGTASETENLYIAVQSTQTPSAIYGPGFPGLQRDSLTSDLVVDAGNRTGNTGPGNATTYAFTVENIGDETREVSLSTDGPEAWIAEPSPSEFEVPAGGTVEANLTVAAPGNLPNGAEARHLVTVASAEETVTFGKTTTVVPGQGEAAPELLDVSSTEESGSAVGELIDEFSVELVATAVVGVGAFVGKQLIF